jgi:nucleotide-binding universal stress UspA family protein
MIVVGSRELSFIQRLVGQSVSEVVQRKAHCDVLIVH